MNKKTIFFTAVAVVATAVSYFSPPAESKAVHHRTGQHGVVPHVGLSRVHPRKPVHLARSLVGVHPGKGHAIAHGAPGHTTALHVAQVPAKTVPIAAAKPVSRELAAYNCELAGIQFYKQGKYADAAAKYRAALALNRTADLYYNLGITLEQLEDTRAAAAAAQKAVELEPQNKAYVELFARVTTDSVAVAAQPQTRSYSQTQSYGSAGGSSYGSSAGSQSYEPSTGSESYGDSQVQAQSFLPGNSRSDEAVAAAAESSQPVRINSVQSAADLSELDRLLKR